MEDLATSMLSIASESLEGGHPQQALLILGSIKDIDFSGQKRARYLEAVATSRVNLESLRRARTSFNSLLRDTKEQIVPRANTLRALAEIRLTLGEVNDSTIDNQLAEAASIYFEQDIMQGLGKTVILQGLVHMRRGDLSEAKRLIIRGITLSGIKSPDVVPLSFSSGSTNGQVSDMSGQMAAVTTY